MQVTHGLARNGNKLLLYPKAEQMRCSELTQWSPVEKEDPFHCWVGLRWD